MNKTILITGITGKLGQYLAKRFHENGYSVIGVDVTNPSLVDSQLLEVLTGYYECNFLDINEIEGFITKVFLDYPNINHILNNAGLKSFGIFTEFDNDEIINVYKLNTIAPLLIIKHSIKHFENINSGHIINISSNAAFEGYKNGSIYSSSKAALNIFTESIGYEIKNPNITINSICPSTISFNRNTYKSEKEYNKFVSSREVFIKLVEIFNSNKSGKVIPIIKTRGKIRYLIIFFIKHLKWILNAI